MKIVWVSNVEIWHHQNSSSYRSLSILMLCKTCDKFSIWKFKSYGLIWPKCQKIVLPFFRKMPYLTIGLSYSLHYELIWTASYDFLLVFLMIYSPKDNRWDKKYKNLFLAFFVIFRFCHQNGDKKQGFQYFSMKI